MAHDRKRRYQEWSKNDFSDRRPNMSPVGWQFLIFWMTLVTYPKMTATPSPHVSEFAYVPRIHPSRNPACRSRYTGVKKNPSDHGFDRPSIEVRAVLAPCSTFSVDKAFDIKDKNLYNREERSSEDNRWTIKNCTEKIVINMRLNNIGPTDTRDKFVVIDHAVDPATMKKFPLQNPYVIKLRQEPVLQLYGLKFKSWVAALFYQSPISGEASRKVVVLSIDDQVPAERLYSRDLAGKIIDRETLNKVVNAEAREDVINNETPNFRGCTVDGENPTCGQAIMRGEPVPFSQGFCCSCDPKIKPAANASFAAAKSLPAEEDEPSTSSKGANKPCNRLLSASGRANSDSDPMARSQADETNVQSRDKSNTSENLPCEPILLGTYSSKSVELVKDAQKRRHRPSDNNQDQAQREPLSSSPKDNVAPSFKSKDRREQNNTNDSSTPESKWSSATTAATLSEKILLIETAQNPSSEPRIEAKIMIASPEDAAEIKDRVKIAAKVEDPAKLARNVEDHGKIFLEPRTKIKHVTGSAEDAEEAKNGVKIAAKIKDRARMVADVEDSAKIARNFEGRAEVSAEQRTKIKYSTGSPEDTAEVKDRVKVAAKVEDPAKLARNVEDHGKIFLEPRTKIKHVTGSAEDAAEAKDGVKIAVKVEDPAKLARNVEDHGKIFLEPRTKIKHLTGSAEAAAEAKDGVKIAAKVEDPSKLARNLEDRAETAAEPRTKMKHLTGSAETAAKAKDGVKIAAKVEDLGKVAAEDVENIAEDLSYRRSMEENMILHEEGRAYVPEDAMQIKSTPRRDEKSLFPGKKSAKRTNQPVIRLESPFRSKQRVGKKRAGRGWTGSGADEGLEDPKGCKRCYGSGSLRGRGRVAANRNKAEENGRAAIDSPMIRAAMHLNEPLKNLSTGVLNSDWSPAGSSASRSGNLNSVMEAGRPDIMAGSFNEKHEDGYFQSDGNEGDIGSARFARMTPILEENVSLLRDEVIENYTPQKRTLKDVAYEEYAGERGKEVRTNGAKRCGRYVRHRPRKKNKGWKGKKRLKRWRGRGKVEVKRDAARQTIQVYLNEARTFPLLTTPKSTINASRSTSPEAASSAKNVVKPEPGPENEANRQDSLDKQIEEKFSRISDALKEDAAGLKSTASASTSASTSPPPLPSKPSIDGTSERSISQRPGNKFSEPNDASHRRNNEAGNENVLEESLPDSNDLSIDDRGGVNKNLGPYLEPERGDEGARLIPSRFTGLMAGTTTTLDVLIPEVSSSVGTIPFPSVTAKDSELTNAVIVVDVFQIATGPPDTLTTLKQTISPDRPAKRINKQALTQSSTFRPVDSTFQLTEGTTILLVESTSMTAEDNDTVTTNADATLITHPAFRPSIKPFEGPTRRTEFDDEISLDDTTFAEETERPTTVRGFRGSISSDANPVGRIRKTWMGFPGRKKKRTTPSMIKTRDLSTHRGAGCRTGISRVDPGYHGARKNPESGMKFSLETGEMNMLKKVVGATGRILREHSNYVQLSVDGSGDGSSDDDLLGKDESSRQYRESVDRNILQHPWIFTTEAAEFTVRPDGSLRKGLGKNKHKVRKTDLVERVGEVTGRILPPCAGEKERGVVQGRGCEMRMHQRRLMSLENLEMVQRVERHWPKSGENCFLKDNDGIQEVDETKLDPKSTASHCLKNNFEKGTRESKPSHRRLLSVQSPKLPKHLPKVDGNKVNEGHLINDRDTETDDASRLDPVKSTKSPQKSKKRDTIQKQKKSSAKRNSKQHASSSSPSDSMDDYLSTEEKDYDDGALAEETQQNDLEEEDEERRFNNPEELGMDYENDSPEDVSRVSEGQQDDSYNLIDVPIPVHLDKLSEKLKIESQARSDRSSIDGETAGKDFEISLTGKIHLGNDELGRPVSVSLDAAGSPGTEPDPEGLASYRSPESASSFNDGTDTLAADNANFLPGGFNPVPFDNAEDRSSRRDYYLRPVRTRTPNGEHGRQRLLRLRKKSAEAGLNHEGRPWNGARINGAAMNEDLKSLVKDRGPSRLGQEANLVPEESEARDKATIGGTAANEDLKSLFKVKGPCRLGQEASLVPEESEANDKAAISGAAGNEDLKSLFKVEGSSGLGEGAGLGPEESEVRDDEQSPGSEENEPLTAKGRSRRDYDLRPDDECDRRKVLHKDSGLRLDASLAPKEPEEGDGASNRAGISEAVNEDLKSLVKDPGSSGQDAGLVPEEAEAKEQSADFEENEPADVGGQSRRDYPRPNNEHDCHGLLNLQKKSAEASLDLESEPAKSSNRVGINEAATNEDTKSLMKDSSSSSLGQGASPIRQEPEVKDDKQSSNVNRDESGDAEDPSRGSYVMPSGEVFSKKMLSNLLGNAPQVALDFGSLPGQVDSGLEGDSDLGEHLKPITIRINTSQCEDSNCTTLKIDLVEVTTTLEYTTEAATTVRDAEVYSERAETTVRQIERVTTTFSTTQEVLPSKSLPAFQLPKPDSTLPNEPEENDESVQKKNMLAMSDLIKRLENLVTDAGNSSNATGHTLVHLKKFIIVPDNRTLWSVREFSEPVKKSTKDAALKDDKTDESPRQEEGSESDNSDLIKEIISSVIRGDNVKREVSPGRSCGKSSCQKCECCDGSSCSKVSKRDSISTSNLEESSPKKKDFQTKIEDSMLKDDDPSKNLDDRVLASNLETSAESSRKVNEVSKRDSMSSGSLEDLESPLKKKDFSSYSKIEDSVVKVDELGPSPETLKKDEVFRRSSSNNPEDPGESSPEYGIPKDATSQNVDVLDSSPETSKKDEVFRSSSNNPEDPGAPVKEFETSGKEDGTVKDASSQNVDVLESSLGTSMESSKKDEVCGQGKPNGKRKRDVSRGDANSPSNKGRKHARHAKKKRRRRKMKKKKGARIKKEHNSGGSKWPLKRNLLMLSEDREGGSERKEEKGDERIRKARDGNMLKEPQTRGGQDCGDHRYPPDVDPFGYLQSAHCLRFSELWYSVYQLDQPVIDHKLHLQIYEKRTKADGSIYWEDLTTGSSIRLGTLDRNYRNHEDTMALAYNDVKVKKSRFDLDHRNDRLLVPSSLSENGEKSTEDRGWLGEYLVLQANEINENADECDKAGVGFAAFVKQPDRCEHVRGTCLKNQPLAYWRHDTEARDSGQAGCYFLSNFAEVPAEAIKYNANGTGSSEFLGLEYHSPHVSVIDVELTADYNALLRPGSFGRLTEVSSYSTGSDYTVIAAVITNKGSYSSSYRLRITDCPEGVPSSWTTIESPTRIVSAHRDRKISLDLYGRLSLNEFSCSVALLNRDGEPVASRQIKVRKMDRCFCVRHCKCYCEGNAHGNRCEPMSLESYHAAGFHGTIPSMTYDFFTRHGPVNVVCLFLIALLFLLLLMGFLKWLIGLWVPTVSRWGLDAIVDSSQMKTYFEKDLTSRPIVLDQHGTPVHPDTHQKTVRVCSRKFVFLFNLVFFFIYPFTSCHWRCKRNCQPPNQAESNINMELKPLPTSSEEDPSETVCVSTYGDSVNSNLEAEDTRYVIDELKKSQESLRNHCRYERDTDSHRSSSD